MLWQTILTLSRVAARLETPIEVGNHNGELYAIDAKTGKPAWEFQTEASRKDPMKLLNPDGSLNPEAFAPVFGDFQDRYIDVELSAP